MDRVLGRARQPLQQHVAVAQQRQREGAHDLFLADNGLRHLAHHGLDGVEIFAGQVLFLCGQVILRAERGLRGIIAAGFQAAQSRSARKRWDR